MTVAGLCPTCGHALDPDDAPPCPRCLLLGALLSRPSGHETLDGETRPEEPARRDATAAEAPHHLLSRIVTILAEDDLGTVYLARGTDGRLATVRLLPRTGDVTAVVRRLETLRIRLADLGDPCIVPIDAVGMTQEGRPFLVGEYLAGQTPLRHSGDRPAPSDVTRSEVEGPAPSEVRRSGVEGARLLDRVAETLSRAHRAGLVHGRLRLSNVVVVQDRGGLAPRLLDFGLGPALAGEGAEDPAVDLVALGRLRKQIL